MRMWIVTLSAAALLAPGPARGDDRATARGDREPSTNQPLKIGAVASGPGSVTIFRALRYYFARNRLPVEFVLYSNYDGLTQALLKKQVDVAWNSPLAHARFHLAAGESQTLVMRDVDV